MKRAKKSLVQPILPNLRSTRGFAVLLYSYIVTWFVVMFTTTLLAMSTLDVNYAQRAIATHQAFWAAEGELEGSVAQLRVANTVPALANNVCQPYGSRTLKSGSISSTSNLCGTTLPNNYRLDITGTSGSTNQRLSTIIQYAGPGTTQFAHVAFANEISARGLVTGSINTSVSRLLTASSIRDEGGNLATKKSVRMLMELWDGVRYIDQDKPPVEILEDSEIYGNIFLGPGWDGRNDDDDKKVEHGVSATFGPIQPLPADIPWPVIEVPSGATALGMLKLDNATPKRCLDAGTYEADGLILKKDTELCTVGTVELYITGSTLETPADRDDNEPLLTKVHVDKEAQLYGQPAGIETTAAGSPYLKQYSPQDLRIFVVGEGLVKIGSKNSVTAALIYAPNAKVKAKGGTFLGAIIARRIETLKDGSAKAKFVYDNALTSQSIPVGSAADVNIKVWTAVD